MAPIIPTPPAPLDPDYKQPAVIASLPAEAPSKQILETLERDGGLILTGLVSQQDLAAIEVELEQYQSTAPPTQDKALHIIPRETIAIPGLVGKSATIAKICSENPILETLRKEILEEKFSVIREEITEENVIDPLLSLSITLNIGYGAPRQRLHRDDNVHGIRHLHKFDLRKVSQFGCLVAATRTTQQNGATMFVPGSHLWDDTRVPRTDEVCFAEMEPGSALIFLASCYHGGGHNSVPNTVRKMHGLFFVRGNLRTEENQFLAVPRSKILDMSPKMLSLLGYKKPTTVLGIVENDDPANDLAGIFERVAT